jgi:hypothetical protein
MEATVDFEKKIASLQAMYKPREKKCFYTSAAERAILR